MSFNDKIKNFIISCENDNFINIIIKWSQYRRTNINYTNIIIKHSNSTRNIRISYIYNTIGIIVNTLMSSKNTCPIYINNPYWNILYSIIRFNITIILITLCKYTYSTSRFCTIIRTIICFIAFYIYFTW